jgi:hypothetical protein
MPPVMQVALGEWNTKVDPDTNEQGEELPRLVLKNLEPVMFFIYLFYSLLGSYINSRITNHKFRIILVQ